MVCSNEPCVGCTELAELDRTKATSQNFLDLIRKRLVNKTTLNSWHDRLAGRLPVEIVSLIFIFFQNVNEPGAEEVMSIRERENWDHLLRGPMLLSRVCSKWRQVVLTTPQLWTKYYFNAWTMAGKTELLAEFLSRSGSLPLSIMVYGDLDDEPVISLDPLIALIRSYSARWKFLDVEYVPEGLTHKLLQKLDSIPPSLFEGLRIDYLDLLERIPLREHIRPKYLRIGRVREAAALPNIPLQLHNITFLELSDISINSLLHIVKQTPRLKKWISDDVAISFEDIAPPPQTGPILIPTVEHLALTFKDNDAEFFSYITLPALTHLQCHFGDDPIDNRDLQFDDLIAFLARSELNSDSLQTFDLHYDIVGVDYDHRFIELDALTHLSVRILGRQNMVTDPYLSGMSDISILPHLRRLKIDTPKMPRSSWALLCDVFQGGFISTNDNVFIDPADSTTPTPSEATNILQRFHERPLEYVSVVVHPRLGEPTRIKYEQYRVLQKIQDRGAIQLVFKDHFTWHHSVDILKNMRQLYRGLL